MPRAKSTVDIDAACKQHLDRKWNERLETKGTTENYHNLLDGINKALDKYEVEINNEVPEPERTMYNKVEKAHAMVDVVYARYIDAKGAG